MALRTLSRAFGQVHAVGHAVQLGVLLADRFLEAVHAAAGVVVVGEAGELHVAAAVLPPLASSSALAAVPSVRPPTMLSVPM